MNINLNQELNWKEFVVDRLDVGVFLVDRSLNVLFWNRFMAMHTGKKADDVVGKPLPELFPEISVRWLARKVEGVFVLKNQAFSRWEQRPYLFKLVHNRPMTSGIEAMYQDLTFMPVMDMGGKVIAVCVSLMDVTDAAMYATELKEARVRLEQDKAEQQVLIKKLEEAQSQLLQSEKMAAIGQLAAGVAHEINNPVGFIKSNISTLQKYTQDLMRLLKCYESVQPHLAPEAGAVEQIEQLKAEIDFEFLLEDIDSLIDESTEGVERVSKIVKDLKDFSHVDQGEWQEEDLHKCLDSTLNVAWNELKYKVELIKEYGDIPPVYCMGSQINQVFLNMLVNAAHAIETRGTITITTRQEGEDVVISIADTGCGMNEDQKRRVFEPFFTTKGVGKGTGLGMSLSYGIIEKHDGAITIDTEPGVGTTFHIRLPIKGAGVQD